MSYRTKKLLKDLKGGRTSVDKVLAALKDLPFKDLGFAKVDNHRSLRRGFPEVIFGKGKTPEQIIKIAGKIIFHDGILLVTRTDIGVYRKLKRLYPKIKFDKSSGAIYYAKKPPVMKGGTVMKSCISTAAQRADPGSLRANT